MQKIKQMAEQSKTKRNEWSTVQPFSALVNNPFIDELTTVDPSKQENRPYSKIEREGRQECLSALHERMVTFLQKTRRLLKSHNSNSPPSPESEKDRAYILDAVNDFYSAEQLLFDYITVSRRNQLSVFRELSQQEDPNASVPQIQVEVNPEEIKIVMPRLRPRFLASRPEPMATKHLIAALERVKLPHWPQWEASFVHVYSKKYSTKTPTDVDNYDYKRTIDVIALMMGTADTGGAFRMETDTFYSDYLASGTYIRIRPKSSNSWVSTLEEEAQTGKHKQRRIPNKLR